LAVIEYGDVTMPDTLVGSSGKSMSQQESDKTQALEAPMASAGPSWLDQDETLRRLWSENKSPEDISVALGRSVAAIMTRAARLGLPRRAAPGRKRGYKRSDVPRKLPPAGTARVRVTLPAPHDEDIEPYAAPQVMPRVCLMCLGKFQSQGRHNRICPSCKGSAEYSTGSSTPDFSFKVIS